MARPAYLASRKTDGVSLDGIIDSWWSFVLLDDVAGARNAMDGEEVENAFSWMISSVG
jgi:hypothetical protein